MDLQNLTDEQLAAELAKREEKAKKERIAEKQAYEHDRNELVHFLSSNALNVHENMKAFKNIAVEEMEAFYKRAQKYGNVRSNSKGGFGLRSNDGNFRVVLERNTKVEYDERANIAEKLIREFLGDMVKKRDQQAYEIITTLLQRGKDGKFNPAAVAALLKWEDSYKDERWTRAMKLFKESHNIIVIGFNVSFSKKNSEDKDENIALTFSSIPVSEKPKENVSEDNENEDSST